MENVGLEVFTFPYSEIDESRLSARTKTDDFLGRDFFNLRISAGYP